MKCEVCGKFMTYITTYDFTDYYICIDECEGTEVADPNSEEKNMEFADKINNLNPNDH